MNCARLLIENVEVDSVEAHGIHLSNSGPTESQRLTNVTIRNCGTAPGTTYGSAFAATNGELSFALLTDKSTVQPDAGMDATQLFQ